MEKEVATSDNETIAKEGHDSTQFITTIATTNLLHFSIENRTTQVSKETFAWKVARNFSNNFITKPHNKDGMFTITLLNKDRIFFNHEGDSFWSISRF